MSLRLLLSLLYLKRSSNEVPLAALHVYQEITMFRVNAFTQKGTKFRFRVQGDSIHAVRETINTIFAGRKMRLILVEPV